MLEQGQERSGRAVCRKGHWAVGWRGERKGRRWLRKQ